MTKRTISFLVLMLSAASAIVLVRSGDVVRSTQGSVLANGWRVTPWGAITGLGTLPLHMVEDSSGRWLAVTNAGYGVQSLSIIDERDGQIVDSQPLAATFYGVAFAPDSSAFYVSTAADAKVLRFRLSGAGMLAPPETIFSIPAASKNQRHWLSGIAVSRNGQNLFVTDGLRNELFAIDIHGTVRWTATVADQPYTVVLSMDGSRAYVSDWASGSVSVVDTANGNVVATVPVCGHPNAELMRPDGRALYVACANDNKVANIDPAGNRLRLTIDVGLFDRALEGATPNGLALSPDGGTLFVADADENAVAAVNVSMDLPRDPRLGIMTVRPHVYGALPAGWYATDVAVSRDGKQLFILDGKGISGHANPKFPHLSALTRAQMSADTYRYAVANLATGDLERMPYPNPEKLATGLAQARADSPYADFASGRASAGRASATATWLPPIKHVLYIIKENRTYDEVLGDDPRGNGDPSLAIFGRKITPNIHRLAHDFVLLDNYYTDSEVSADGHNWGTAAYATDYVAKLWPSAYSDRHRDYDFEQQGPASPSSGYIWDDVRRHGLSMRDYGEFVKFGTYAAVFPATSAAVGLGGVVCPSFAGFDNEVTDQKRADAWLREFRGYVAGGNLPAFEIMRLPNDHTAGTRPHLHTPYAMLADNDYALARMVDAVSHSRYWRDTIIFVTEDDAQFGPDHVSDQRAEALVIGAWVKRGYVDHRHYSMTGMLHTIELLLKLPPMSVFDAGGQAMTADFAAHADTRGWRASPPLVDLNAMNPVDAVDAKASMRLDFSRADAADPIELNAILYDFARTHAP